MSANQCPSTAVIEAFLLGVLPEAEVAEIACHLESCRTCDAVVQTLENRSDPLIAGLRLRPPEGQNSAADTALGLASVEQAPQTWPAPAGYQVLGELGHGGMGVVYRARHLALQRIVALKVLRPGGESRTAELRRFRSEAQAAARLQHPHIVQIYEVGEHNGRPFFALEYVPGGNLAEHLDSTPQPPRPSAELVETLARAIHYAHERGIVHRDLKPANILLQREETTNNTNQTNQDDIEPEEQHETNAEGPPPSTALLSSSPIRGIREIRGFSPKITDFGLARQLDGDSGQTGSGAVLGTPSYMAPEQATGQTASAGPAADVYALGAILYECLTGRPPFKAATVLDTLEQVRSQEPVPPRSFQPQTPRDLETICLKCLRKEPHERYGSALKLAEDLRRFLEGRPIVARPVNWAERCGRWCRRNPVVASLGGTVAALLLTVAVVSTAQALRIAAARDGEIKARKEVEDRAEENRALLGGQYVENGRRLLDQGDLSGALLWFVAALQQDPNDPERVALHRLRIGTLLRECPRPEYVWSHADTVNDAVYSPDGRRLATAGDDAAARVWDATTGAAVAVLRHPQPVRRVQFSSDGRRLLTLSGAGDVFSSADMAVRVWDVETGRPLTPPLKHVPHDGTAPGLAGASLSPDGSRLLTRLDEQTAQLWDAATGTAVGPPWHHTLRYLTACFNADGSQALTITVQLGTPQTPPLTEVRAWDPIQGKPASPPRTLPGQPPVEGALSPDHRLVLTSGDHNLRLWELATGRALGEYARNDATLSPPAFSTDGSRLVVSLTDTNTRRCSSQVLEAATGQPLGQSFDSGEPEQRQTVLSPDGRRALTSGRGHTVRVWDTATGRSIGWPLRQEAAVTQVSFSPDGTRVLTVGIDHAVRVWEAATGLPLTPLLKHEGPIGAAAFSPDGRHLLTVSGYTARTWDLAAGSSAVRLLKPPAPPLGAWLAPDGRHVLTVFGPADSPRSAALWEADTGESVPLELPAREGPLQAAFNADGRRLLIVRNTRHRVSPAQPNADDVRVWDTASGALTARIRCEGRCSTAVFDAEGRRVLTSQGDGSAVLWDAATGASLAGALRHQADGWVLARFSPDGRRVLTTTEWPPGPPPVLEVRLWDAATGTPCGAALRPAGDQVMTLFNPLSQVGFSPDGEQLLTVLHDGTCQFWESGTGQAVAPPCIVAGPWGRNSSPIAVNPDGRRVLVIGTETTSSGRAQVWDAGSGRPAGRVLQHEDWIAQAEFSPDGGRVLTAGGDGTARVWDAATGEPLIAPLKHPGLVWRASFSADGRRIFTTSMRSFDSPAGASQAQAQEVRVWDAVTGQPLTPPLASQQPMRMGRDQDARWWFARDGSRVLLFHADGSLEVRELTGDPRPVDELRAEAEVLSGRWINAAGTVLPLEEERFQKGWQRLHAR